MYMYLVTVSFQQCLEPAVATDNYNLALNGTVLVLEFACGVSLHAIHELQSG